MERFQLNATNVLQSDRWQHLTLVELMANEDTKWQANNSKLGQVLVHIHNELKQNANEKAAQAVASLLEGYYDAKTDCRS